MWAYIDPFNPLKNKKKFGLHKIESICRLKSKCNQQFENCFDKGRKHCGKRRKCWLPAFSPFSTMFSKTFFRRVVKSLY